MAFRLWTSPIPSNPVEIAFFDRGPVDEEELITAGYWSAYWYGGYVYGTEIARGLDVFQLEPSDFITENEIAAASLHSADLTVNAQTQERVVWPAVPVVARAYLDQLRRSQTVDAPRAAALVAALDQAEQSIVAGQTDPDTSRTLASLSATFSSQAENRGGIAGQRLQSLADTLQGIAGALR